MSGYLVPLHIWFPWGGSHNTIYQLRTETLFRHSTSQSWRNFLRARAQTVCKFRKKLLWRANRNSEPQNKVLESFIFFINYFINILAYYKYIINAHYNNYITDKGLLWEMQHGRKCCSNWLLLLPVWKASCETFCPLSRIGPVTARPAPQW